MKKAEMKHKMGKSMGMHKMEEKMHMMKEKMSMMKGKKGAKKK